MQGVVNMEVQDSKVVDSVLRKGSAFIVLSEVNPRIFWMAKPAKPHVVYAPFRL